MSVHVTGEEIKDGHVHEIVETSSLVVGRNFAHQSAVIRFQLPLGLPPLVIGSPPGMPPHLGVRCENNDVRARARY